MVEGKLLREEKPTEVVTNSSNGIGGNHGSMFGKVQEPAYDLQYGKLPVRLFPSPMWFPIGKCKVKVITELI